MTTTSRTLGAKQQAAVDAIRGALPETHELTVRLQRADGTVAFAVVSRASGKGALLDGDLAALDAARLPEVVQALVRAADAVA